MICENCEIEHDGCFASGRFCSLKCSRSFVTKSKRSEINKKVSNKLSGRSSTISGKIFKDGKYIVPPNDFNLVRERICKNCGKIETIRWFIKNEFCSKSCSSSYTQKQLAKDGRHNGFPSRLEKQPSWAEKTVMNYFDSLGIQYIRDHKVNRFFGDFAFLNEKVILEIDGHQHKNRKDYDKERDTLIESDGWTVVRIDWIHRDFDKIKEAIDKFILEYLRSNN